MIAMDNQTLFKSGLIAPQRGYEVINASTVVYAQFSKLISVIIFPLHELSEVCRSLPVRRLSKVMFTSSP